MSLLRARRNGLNPGERLTPRTLLLIIGLAVFYTAIGFVIQRIRADSTQWLNPDRIAEISRNLCRRGEFAEMPGQPTVLRGPAYPAALAAPCWITGWDPQSFAPLINGLCHLATLWVLALHPLAPPGRVRAVALLAVGLDPLLLNYAGRTYLEPMLILSVALAIAAIDRLVEKPDLRSMAILGLAWGFGLLVKPILLYLVVALAAALLLFAPRSALFALGSFLIAALIILPWFLRNLAVSGCFIPVATGAWELTLKGDTFSQFALKEDGVVDLERMAKERLRALDRELGIENFPPCAREPYYMREELRRIRTQPGHFAYKLVAQSLAFWTLGGDRHKTLLFLMLQLPVLFLLPAALRFYWRTQRRALLGFYIVGCYMLAAHSISLAIARYSMPLRPWIVLIAASWVANYVTGKPLKMFSRVGPDPQVMQAP